MKSSVALIVLALAPSTLLAAEPCNCKRYPFKPNPPCYDHCVAKYVSEGGVPAGQVADIDPEVARDINVLAERQRSSAVDAAVISNASELNKAASKAILKDLEKINVAQPPPKQTPPD